jgi:hypothetical protein
MYAFVVDSSMGIVLRLSIFGGKKANSELSSQHSAVSSQQSGSARGKDKRRNTRGGGQMAMGESGKRADLRLKKRLPPGGHQTVEWKKSFACSRGV